MKTLFLAFSLIAFSTTLHEFHVSKCQIEYVKAEQSLQISMHIFIDDLEEALRQRGKDQLFICTEREAKEAEQYMIDYIDDRVQLKVNGQAMDFHFLGKEISDDLAAVWCFIEIKGVEPFSSLEVSNKLLQEVFDDKKNIIRIKGPKNKKSYLLFQKGDDFELLEF